jgi:zinc protease
MTPRARRPLLVFLAFFLAAPLQPLAQGPDRSTPPRPGPPPALRLPAIQRKTLSNGLPVWIVELHKVPVVQVTLLVQAGASADPDGQYGAASLTAAMLDEGAGPRTSLQIADALDDLGATLDTSSGFDASAVALWVPVARFHEALAIMADVALRPTFPAAELERLRKERLTSLLEARDDPEEVAQMAFPRVVYGPDRRYGRPVFGTPGSIRALTRAELRSYYAAHYGPAGSSLLVVGDVRPDAAVAELETAFGGWKSGAGIERVPPAALPPPRSAREVYLVDKPGAAQSQIRIGTVGVARSTPDYFPIIVMNTILGGSFTSRLNENLRERHGYTYGAGSGFVMRRSAGPFVASAAVQTDKTADALKEFFVELAGIDKPVPGPELARARNYAALGFPAGFETTGQISGKLEEMITYHLPDEYFASYIPSVEAVTAADVERVAQTYVRPDKLAVVVVGDRRAIEPGIQALNLGPIHVLTVDEVLGK